MPLELAQTAELAAFRSGDPTTLLTQAEALVREFCGWHIAPVRPAEVVTLDGPGGKALFLPSLNVTAITTLVEDGNTLVDGTDFEWSANGVVSRIWGCWSCDPRSIVVTFEHGYAEVPPVVQSVVLDIANRATSVVKAGGLVRLRVGGVDRQFGTASSGQAPVAIGLTEDNEAALARKYWIP